MNDFYITTDDIRKNTFLSIEEFLLEKINNNERTLFLSCDFRLSKVNCKRLCDFLDSNEIEYTYDNNQLFQSVDIKGNIIYFTSIGNGDRPRGLRGNFIIFDDISSLSKDAVLNVIQGGASIRTNYV